MLNLRVAVIIFMGFIARVFALFLLKRHITPQRWEYDDIAINLIRQKAYVVEHLHTAYRSFGYPFYSYFCAFFHRLTNYNYLLLTLLQIFISLLEILKLMDKPLIL